jgi:hypothetical protein
MSSELPLETSYYHSKRNSRATTSKPRTHDKSKQIILTTLFLQANSTFQDIAAPNQQICKWSTTMRATLDYNMNY